MSKRKNPRRLNEIKELDDTKLFCKAFIFHRCEPYEPAPGEFRKPEYGYREVQLCLCGVLRYRLFSRVTGDPLQKHWNYIYPDDYRVIQVGDRNDFRKEYFRRQSKQARNGGK